jgi:hypothetical protein
VAEENTPRCPFEHIKNPDLEAEQIAETTDLTVKLIDKRYPLEGDSRRFLSANCPASIQTLRGVHPKSHGCVKATFTIDPYLETKFQVGLFAEPGRKFDAIIRFSSATATMQADTSINELTGKKEHDSRGMAIKVLDVGGEVLTEDNGAHNQDFLMINQPMFAFANTEDYLRLNKVLDEDVIKFFKEPPDTPEQGRRIGETSKIINGPNGIKETDVGNPLGIQYFSAAPFLFGSDQVMKFSAKPCTEVYPVHSPDPLTEKENNYLREALTKTVSVNGVITFDFMVQLRSEVNEVDIENASEEWKESEFKFEKVATITIQLPQLDVDSEENIVHCEKLTFTPWHSLVEHKPIGSINRLRKSVYQASAEHRLKADAP